MDKQTLKQAGALLVVMVASGLITHYVIDAHIKYGGHKPAIAAAPAAAPVAPAAAKS